MTGVQTCALPIWGVPPERILDYLSLTGHASDNIPGVPGVGDKTALKLLTEYGAFDAIWERIAEVKPDGVRKKLEAGKESAMLSRRLVTLAYDAPLSVSSFDELAVPRLDRDAASVVFMREGMRSLATRRVADGMPPEPGDLFAPAAGPLAGGVHAGAVPPAGAARVGEIRPEADGGAQNAAMTADRKSVV